MSSAHDGSPATGRETLPPQPALGLRQPLLWLAETWRRRLLALGLASLALALVTAAQLTTLLSAVGDSPDYLDVLGRHVPIWLFWSAVGLGLLPLWRATRRGLPLWLHLIVHAAASILVAAAAAQIILILTEPLRVRSEIARAIGNAESVMPRLLIPGIFVYWAICGLGALIDSLRLLDRRQHQVEQAERHAADLQASLERAQFDLLQRQIQPHFLFNTLNTVVGLLREGDKERSTEIVLALGGLLRATLEKGAATTVALADEVDLVRQYVRIQEARFGPRLSIAWDLDPSVLGTHLPPILLLTLVENVVEHALREGSADRIRIAARAVDGETELEILDSGPGFPPEILNGSYAGIGLSNCRDRLRMVFGPRQSFEVENPPQGGARVRVRVPGTPMDTRPNFTLGRDATAHSAP